MKLFFDEDMGRGIPEAFWHLDFDTDYVGRDEHSVPFGMPDEDWLPIIGESGWLLVSCNKAILEHPVQRGIFQNSSLGAVFLTTGQGRKLKVFKLLLRKYDWLEQIDETIARPFAFGLTLSGRVRRLL